MRRAAAILALCLTSGAVPALADGLAEDLAVFQKVCVQQAPDLSETAISAMAKKSSIGVYDPGGGGTVEAIEGRYCSIKMRRGSMLVSPVTEAEAERVVSQFAAKIGATDISKKVRKNGNSLSYTVKRGKGEVTFMFVADRSVRKLSISKRGKL